MRKWMWWAAGAGLLWYVWKRGNVVQSEVTGGGTVAQTPTGGMGGSA